MKRLVKMVVLVVLSGLVIVGLGSCPNPASPQDNTEENQTSDNESTDDGTKDDSGDDSGSSDPGDDPSNSGPSPPYIVTGDGEDPSVRAVTIPYDGTARTVTYQLAINVDGSGQKDPDGDVVYFRCTTDPASLSYLTLDANTGLVTVTNYADSSDLVLQFYSEDETGLDTSGDLFTVTFAVGAGT